MILLEASNVTYEIKNKKLLDIDHIQIQKNDRIGLVGRNGSGKTTLLEILSGKREQSAGTLTSRSTIELIPQLKNTNTTKSGGEVTQEYINRSLSKHADILLADEPTTNLDTNHIERLETQLAKWKGAIVIVSHDRTFLDAICNQIWEIEDAKLAIYKGNYSNYREQKQLKIRQQENAYDQYVKKKKQLENALELKEQKAQRATKIPKKTSSSEAKITGAKPYFAKKQKKLQKSKKSIETRLEKLEKVDKVQEKPPIKMNLPYEETLKGKIVLRVEDLEGVVGNHVLWSPVSFHMKGGEKIAIIGKNGAGKTSLIRKLINQEDGVSISPSMKVGYFSQNLDVLDSKQSILENVQTTSKQDETLIRTVLARLHFFREDVYKKVRVLSGGERVKVAFAKLFVSDINTLILDEPTNFLDIETLEALEELLANYKGTVLFVSHDRRFIEKLATTIISIEKKEIHVFEGTYDEFKNYSPKMPNDSEEDELLVIETKISEVLSKLSIEPTDELEEEFQLLLSKKRKIIEGRE
ncbi:Vga family ABC-F type ribosomal protection protein [Oceanobacillus halophilus]|uniref:ABC-F type ribosomal protection protein n=1 Tax=Oceanobacillus halophilus TaxID=930130 RepID=A0A494ZT53_9BACI|nr:ABC-F type ribosomal protection protein [Oceanobacillus halophilus]RKQ28794.1 ABC-F type ribosomal protection protein [Oceanobacillus halophilus]